MHVSFDLNYSDISNIIICNMLDLCFYIKCHRI